MNGTEMKNVLLRFLLLCNVVLLATIAVFGVRGAIRTSQQSRETITLLQSRGVEISGGVYRSLLEKKTAYTLRTDVDAQEKFCRGVLGKTLDSHAASGGSINWKSDAGNITWDIEGTVNGTVTLAEDSVPQDADSAKAVVTKWLHYGGINLRQTAVEASNDGEMLLVRVQEGVKGRNLSGCELKFETSSTGMVTISGQWCFGDPQPVEMKALNDSTPADILLAAVNAHSDVTQVTAAQQVYILTNRSGGRFSIHPCWKLTTDKGDVVIDPLTGEEVTENNEQQSTTDTPATDSTDGTYPTDGTTDGTQTLPSDTTDPNGATTQPDDGTTDDNSSTDNPSITGDDNWDSSQGTDKTDPEVPDANGVYG